MPGAAPIVWIMLAAVAAGQSRPADSAPASRVPSPLARLESPRGMLDRGTYTLELRDDGTLLFEGDPGGVLHSICLPGRHRGRVSLEEVEKTRNAFLDAGYLSFKDRYVDKNVFDAGAAGTSFWHEGVEKHVWRDFGDPSAPPVLSALEYRLADLVNPRWRAPGISWLSNHQSADGSWSVSGLPSRCDLLDAPTCGGEPSDKSWIAVATTAVALLPLCGAGSRQFGFENASGEAYRRGLEFLMKQQSEDGRFGVRDDGLAAFADAWALAALCSPRAGTTREVRERRSAAEKVLAALIAMQAADGSWRAPAGAEDGEIISTAWGALALHCAQRTSISFDGRRLGMAARFLEEHAEFLAAALPNPADGRSGARAWRAAAMAIVAAKWSGVESLSPAQRALADVLENETLMPAAKDGDPDPAAIFFGMRALESLDSDKRSTVLWRVVKAKKSLEGCRAGSWDARAGWERGGGRIYSTAVMLLCELAVYRTPNIPGAR